MKRLLFVVLLLAGALAFPSGPAEAAACTGSSGVTVVVQFPDRTEVGCAAGDPGSGFAALLAAGFDYTIVTRFPGALCQIDRYPDSVCQNMPPASAYWRYYRAKHGGDWAPSNYGASSTNPKPGSFEGWRFGNNPPAPAYHIPAAPAPTSATTPRPTSHSTSHPTSRSSNPVVRPATPGQPSASAPSAPDAGSSASADPTPDATGRPTRVPHASASASDLAGPATQVSAATGPVSQENASSGRSSGNRSWIWGVVLVMVLGGAAVATAITRRKV